jgi:hypothetical protein
MIGCFGCCNRRYHSLTPITFGRIVDNGRCSDFFQDGRFYKEWRTNDGKDGRFTVRCPKANARQIGERKNEKLSEQNMNLESKNLHRNLHRLV